jgi:hypothetical protein
MSRHAAGFCIRVSPTLAFQTALDSPLCARNKPEVEQHQ